MALIMLRASYSSACPNRDPSEGNPAGVPQAPCPRGPVRAVRALSAPAPLGEAAGAQRQWTARSCPPPTGAAHCLLLCCVVSGARGLSFVGACCGESLPAYYPPPHAPPPPPQASCVRWALLTPAGLQLPRGPDTGTPLPGPQVSFPGKLPLGLPHPPFPAFHARKPEWGGAVQRWPGVFVGTGTPKAISGLDKPPALSLPRNLIQAWAVGTCLAAQHLDRAAPVRTRSWGGAGATCDPDTWKKTLHS